MYKTVSGLDVHKDSIFAVFCALMDEKFNTSSEF